MKKNNWAPVVYISVLLGKEQGCGYKVNCFIRTEIVFIWNHSFGVSDKTENASQGIYNPLASGGLERSPDPRCNASAPRPEGPAHQRRGKKGKLFSQNRNTFHLESLILGTCHP